MATQDYAASFQGVAIRVTRLDEQGNLLNGPADSYTTSAFIRTSFTPEYEEGDEITEKAADGTVCVSFKAPDTLKRVNLEIAICDPDPELSALMSGGLMLSGQNSGKEQVQGWASAQVGEDPSGNGVAVEVWSRAIQNGKPAADKPYFRWVFPYVKTRLSGDRVIENGLLATTFEGFGLGNINFRSGIDQTWKWPAAVDRPYLYAREQWAPQGLRGFYQWSKAGGVDPDTWKGAGSPVADDLNSVTDPTNKGVAVNVPGGANPYPYRDSVPEDFILSVADFLPSAKPGAAVFNASAASQDVANKAPAAPAAQNPVTYLSRKDPLLLEDYSLRDHEDLSDRIFVSGLNKPQSFSTLQADQSLRNVQVNQLSGGDPVQGLVAFPAGSFITLGDGSKAHFDGTNWVAGVSPFGPEYAEDRNGDGTWEFYPTGDGFVLPADVDALNAMDPQVRPRPDRAWTIGQTIPIQSGGVYWDGTAWQTGTAP
jgi:hypothetical protein